MDLENSFVVPANIETAWQTLLDVEAIAPCMPGATLESVNGDEFSGNVKVKLGPVSMTYQGTARFVTKDASQHRAVIEGNGRESRGTGTASALVTAQLVAESEQRTRVDVTTVLTITGKAAQFGRGVMQDVAGRLIDQFAGNLESVLSTSSASSPPPIQTADSIDLLGTAGAPVLKRLIPVAIGVVVVGALIWFLVAR
ncbi:MAG: SRPBCC family protein [Actinomycetales bacterium]|nr:SRPBCC family protein [Actinomycetales bacterium]